MDSRGGGPRSVRAAVAAALTARGATELAAAAAALHSAPPTDPAAFAEWTTMILPAAIIASSKVATARRRVGGTSGSAAATSAVRGLTALRNLGLRPSTYLALHAAAAIETLASSLDSGAADAARLEQAVSTLQVRSAGIAILMMATLRAPLFRRSDAPRAESACAPARECARGGDVGE
jgi:hypothetical protein